MKIWITKYALTSTGIIERVGKRVKKSWGDEVVASDLSGRYSVHYDPWDWFESEEEALKMALRLVDEEMITKVGFLNQLKERYTQRLNQIGSCIDSVEYVTDTEGK